MIIFFNKVLLVFNVKNNREVSILLYAFTLNAIFFILQFPNLEFTFSHGGDSPLVWVFNYLFTNDFTSSRTILFPHGPLDFLTTAPLRNNLFYYFSIYFIVKFIFIYLCFMTNKIVHKSNNWIVIAGFSYIIFSLSDIIFVTLLCILLAFILFFETQKYYWKHLGFILIAFSVYIRTYSCVLAGCLGVSFILYYLITSKNIKLFFANILGLFSCVFLFYVFLFHQANGFITFLLGSINLTLENSSACAYYPENNWWLIISSILISITLPFINNTKQSFFYGSIMIAPLFCAFKHGMAREEWVHATGFWLYLFLYYLFFLFYVRSKAILNLILVTLSLIFLFINFNNYTFKIYQVPSIPICTLNNFLNFVSNYDGILNSADEQIRTNISYRKLSPQLREKIANKSVDVYPWDYSIIAANNFNWHPRPVINSYTAYTSWLDKQDANYFNSTLAPEYFIWDFSLGLSKSINESDLHSIDYRYLLNDEPQTLISILSNYQFITYENNLNIYKKRPETLTYIVKKQEPDIKKINNWINVPLDSNNDLQRVKIYFYKTLLQKLKSFFYKDEQYWIYLKLSDSSIQKYKIVPKNAEDGVWLNPFIYQPINTTNKLRVSEIMLKNSNEELLNSNVKIQFEIVQFNKKNIATDFFPTAISKSDTVYFDKTITFENNDTIQEFNFKGGNTLKNNGINNSKGFTILPNQFSPSFKVSIDFFDFTDVKSTCWVKKSTSNLAYVFSFEDSNGNMIEWKSTSISEQRLNKCGFELSSFYVNLPYNEKIKKVSVSIWNVSKIDTVVFDDFYLKVKGINNYHLK